MTMQLVRSRSQEDLDFIGPISPDALGDHIPGQELKCWAEPNAVFPWLPLYHR